MSEPIEIDYALPDVQRPPSEWLFRLSRGLAGIAGVVGVAILATYFVLERPWLISAGLFWLGIGGLLAFVAFACGATYAATAYTRGFPAPATVRRAVFAVLLPLAMVPLAFACATLGVRAADRVARSIDVVNAGDVPIDAIELVNEAGPRALGPLAAGATLRARVPPGAETVAFRVRRGGVWTEYDVDGYSIPIPGDPARRVTIDVEGRVTLTERGRPPRPLDPTTAPATAASD